MMPDQDKVYETEPFEFLEFDRSAITFPALEKGITNC